MTSLRRYTRAEVEAALAEAELQMGERAGLVSAGVARVLADLAHNAIVLQDASDSLSAKCDDGYGCKPCRVLAGLFGEELPTREAANHAIEVCRYEMVTSTNSRHAKSVEALLAIAEWALSLRAARNDEMRAVITEARRQWSAPFGNPTNAPMIEMEYRAAERRLLPPWANEGDDHAE